METNERPLEKYPGKWKMTLFALDEFINNDFNTLKVRKGAICPPHLIVLYINP